MSGFPPDLRARTLSTLRDSTIDILILGGGINAAGVARDIGLRRKLSGLTLQAALVEQNHFASAASGKNSQLIHGGLRYLRYMKFALVKEALRERATLRKLAPHLVEPLAFLLPVHTRLDKFKYLAALRLYDQLAGDQNISRHREVSRGELKQLEPQMATEDLIGGVMFYDCKVHAARFVLENLFEAAENGVLIANHTRANPLERLADGSWRVELEDTMSGERFTTVAKKLIDCTGAWSKPPEGAPRLVRGSHVILPRISSEEHAIAYFEGSGRIVFLIPWGSEKQLTLVGTTDVDHDGPPDSARITREEVEYLLGIVRKLYPAAQGMAPLAAYSSLRPLADAGGSSPQAASREHRIWNTPDGILRILGGKYTTYRAMSEQAVDLALKELAPFLAARSATASEPLCGNSEKALQRLRLETQSMAERHYLAPVEVEHLIDLYGVHTPAVLKLVPPADHGPIRRIEYARLAFAIQHEMALSLCALLFVSTYIGYEKRWSAAALEPYAELAGSWLGWSEERRQQEIQQALAVTALP